MVTPDVGSKNELYQMGDDDEWARIGNVKTTSDITLRVFVSPDESGDNFFDALRCDKEEQQTVSMRYKPSNIWFAPEIIHKDVRPSSMIWNHNVATASFAGTGAGITKTFVRWWHRPIWWAYRIWKKITKK